MWNLNFRVGICSKFGTWHLGLDSRPGRAPHTLRRLTRGFEGVSEHSHGNTFGFGKISFNWQNAKSANIDFSRRGTGALPPKKEPSRNPTENRRKNPPTRSEKNGSAKPKLAQNFQKSFQERNSRNSSVWSLKTPGRKIQPRLQMNLREKINSALTMPKFPRAPVMPLRNRAMANMLRSSRSTPRRKCGFAPTKATEKRSSEQ